MAFFTSLLFAISQNIRETSCNTVFETAPETLKRIGGESALLYGPRSGFGSKISKGIESVISKFTVTELPCGSGKKTTSCCPTLVDGVRKERVT